MPFGGPARGRNMLHMMGVMKSPKLTLKAVCVGQNVARLEMLKFIATFFRECGRNAELSETATAEGMEFVDLFGIKPAAGKLEISLRG
jgi:hypothetical protein